MAQLKKLAKQTMTYGVSSILARLTTFVFLTPYLTNNFAKADYGIQTDIYAWAAFLIIPFTYRMETALFRFGSKKEDLPRAFRTAVLSLLFSTFGLVIILLLCSPQIAALLEYPDQTYFIVWMVLIIGLDALSAIPFALLRLQGKAMRFAAVKILHMLFYLGLILFTLELGPGLAESKMLWAEYWYDPDLGIGYVFLANLLANVLMFAMLSPSYFSVRTREKGTPFFDWALWRKMMVYSMPLVVAGFAGIINEVLDRTLLKVLLVGDLDYRLAQVGIYGACYKISIFMSLFTQAFNYAAEPFFFKNADKQHAREMYANIAFLFALVGCMAFMGIMFFMDIIQYFVAAPYREGLVIVPILLIANMFLGLYYNVAAWFKLADKTYFGAIISILGATVTVILNILLIPVLGYLGSAWATLACYVMMVVVCYLLGQKYYPIPYPVGKILGYLFLSVAFFCFFEPIHNLLPEGSLWGYLVGILLLSVYILALYKMDGAKIRQIIRR